MLLFSVLFSLAILSNSSIGLKVTIEWTLGSQLPETKLLDSGVEQDLYCTLDKEVEKFPMWLLCPLVHGVCVNGCRTNFNISCSKQVIQRMTVYHYKFKVFKALEGAWRCQHGPESSRNVKLNVTNKPYIKSFTMNPYPVWKGSPLNLTCAVTPMSQFVNIEIRRAIGETDYSDVPKLSSYKIDSWTSMAIINSSTPGVDDQMQCTVFTQGQDITIQTLKTNIYYFPHKLSITSSATERSYNVGSLISFQCSSDGGNPRPVLNIFHERYGDAPKLLIEPNVVLTKYDNKAHFYCKLAKISGRTSNMRSDSINITVMYPPDKMELREEPEDQLVESQTKKYVCLLPGSSEPLSEIKWSMMDAMGKKIPKYERDNILEFENNENTQTQFVLKSTIRIIMLRNFNGYKITCSIVYRGKNTLSSSKYIKVHFAPNYISLNSNPLDAIQEGQSVSLSCSTGSANPPSKIIWYKTEFGKKTEDITSHSSTDMAPSNYSGTSVSSSLNVHGASRQNHGTIYKCMVSHAYMNSEIIKEYVLHVLFPPVVQVVTFPKQVEEGENVQLQCRALGGNPGSSFQSNFHWEFCPVKMSYQPPLTSDLSNKPSSEIRQFCSQLPDGLSFIQNSVMNLSAVTGKNRGWYSCTIRSVGGSASGFAFLDVFYTPILTYQTPSRVYALRGSDIIFNAQLSSNPIHADIEWYFKQNFKVSSKSFEQDNSHLNIQSMPGSKQLLKMEPYGRIKYSLMDNYTIHLSIKPIMNSDYGEYICQVRNKMGQKTINFQLYPLDDISISESNIRLQFNGRKVTVYYVPPTNGHFSHLMLRTCWLQEIGKCKDMQITDPQSGQAVITMPNQPNLFNYRLLVYNGSTLLQMTSSIPKDTSNAQWIGISMEFMIAIIAGGVGIVLILFVALLALILLRCRRKKPKDNYLENNSIATTNSHQRRQDYMLLNSHQNASLMKNGCHCFSTYPLELRSDNGSDHSVPSQNVYQSMMMRRKVRDNGELSSVHSGGSCHSPDVVLTERTSINSSSNPMVNGTPYSYPIGNGSTKVTLLSGRLHSFDGQRQDTNMPEEYIIPQEMFFTTVDDGLNFSQPRIIPIPKNMASDYPVYFQMNNQIASKPFEMTMPPNYTSVMPQLECNNQDSRESSPTANTDSNHNSGTHDMSKAQTRKESVDKSQIGH